MRAGDRGGVKNPLNEMEEDCGLLRFQRSCVRQPRRVRRREDPSHKEADRMGESLYVMHLMTSGNKAFEVTCNVPREDRWL
jgi:hypothetical protein